MSLKIVGKLKSPKGWGVVCDTDGKVYSGYDQTAYPKNNIVAVTRAAEAAKMYLASNEEPKGGHNFPTIPSAPRPKSGTKPEEMPEEWQEYEKLRAEYMLRREWEDNERIAKLKVMDFYPVLQAEMTFTGYGRGRSSVTMNFQTDDDQCFAFGPSGIDSFINAIAARKIVPTADGKFPIQFRLVKQGDNVYMEPYYDVYEAV